MYSQSSVLLMTISDFRNASSLKVAEVCWLLTDTLFVVMPECSELFRI